jgi:hypothetical protein
MDLEWVDWHEATHLAKYGILLLSNATVLKGFGISLGGILVVPLLKGKEFGYEAFWRRHNEALWLYPQYDAVSACWPAHFREEQEAPLNRFDGKHPPLEKTKAERIAFWSRLGCTAKKDTEDARQVAFIRKATDAGISTLRLQR